MFVTEAMNHFSLKGRPLQISDKRSDVIPDPVSVSAPVGVGYVDYRPKRTDSDSGIQNVAPVSIFEVELHRIGHRLFRWSRCSRCVHDSRDQADIRRTRKGTSIYTLFTPAEGHQVC